MEGYREIGELVSKLRRRMRADDKKEEFRVLDRWPDAAGAKVAGNSRPLFIVDGVLYVETTGASWAQEIHFAKKEIMRKINEFFGKEKVLDIKAQVKG